jgi:hypothetical protein
VHRRKTAGWSCGLRPKYGWIDEAAGAIKAQVEREG